jgi:hypothetical protein
MTGLSVDTHLVVDLDRGEYRERHFDVIVGGQVHGVAAVLLTGEDDPACLCIAPWLPPHLVQAVAHALDYCLGPLEPSPTS